MKLPIESMKVIDKIKEEKKETQQEVYERELKKFGIIIERNRILEIIEEFEKKSSRCIEGQILWDIEDWNKFKKQIEEKNGKQ